MTQGRRDYVDSMFRGSPKQVNLLARAARTPGTCHSLPNEPLITGMGGRGGWGLVVGVCVGGVAVSQTPRRAGRTFRQTRSGLADRSSLWERRLKLEWE